MITPLPIPQTLFPVDRSISNCNVGRINSCDISNTPMQMFSTKAAAAAAVDAFRVVCESCSGSAKSDDAILKIT